MAFVMLTRLRDCIRLGAERDGREPEPPLPVRLCALALAPSDDREVLLDGLTCFFECSYALSSLVIVLAAHALGPSAPPKWRSNEVEQNSGPTNVELGVNCRGG